MPHDGQANSDRSRSSPSGEGGARRSLPRWILASLLIAAACAIQLGCGDPEMRYRTLSFFFDGVPRPGETEADMGESGSPDGEATVAGQAGTAPSQADVMTVYHAPYMARQCAGCHDPQTGYQATAVTAAMCSKCHEGYDQVAPGDWVHGPVVQDRCDLCHLPHKAQFAGLLPQAQPDLCHTCHDPEFTRTDPYHAKLDNPRCSDCHDPHAAGNRLLLADSRTYARRKTGPDRVVSRHPVHERSDCIKCHSVEQSNVLVEAVGAQCLSCHEKVLEAPPGQKLHEAVKEGKCVVCHTAHQAVRPNVLRATAEQMCLPCHEPEKFLTPRHPKVQRVDCTLCHRGHSSPEPKLLKEGVAQVRQDVREAKR